jgi:hypothetical protein
MVPFPLLLSFQRFAPRRNLGLVVHDVEQHASRRLVHVVKFLADQNYTEFPYVSKLWDDWVIIGRAMAEARREALEIVGANNPIGAALQWRRQTS